MKIIPFIISILILLSSCKKDDEPVIHPNPSSFDFVEKIETDKSRYNPGETVTIDLYLKSTDFEMIHVNYKHLTTVVEENTLTATGNQVTLNWLPPTDDFKGYSIEFEFVKDGETADYASTAADVSSDWTNFPRYGFLSKFPVMSSTEISNTIKELNAFHINGLQYYDWHNKHHLPLKMDGDTPASSWMDIARRTISFNTVLGFIQEAKGYNMASMSYNLLYGAWEDYASDGVLDKWMIYNDPNHGTINKHDLDDNWALSDILVLNPANSEWQNYIFQKTAMIYEHLDFDGWHLDQLGHRGTVYDYDGNQRDLWLTFIPFLENLRTAFPGKKMALNAVDQYGQKEILSTDVDFSYTEVWSSNKYGDLAKVILDNFNFNNQINTVLAAYINYDLADSQGQFNEPAVLMADAVIMAFGGDHLELGEHMLGKEYFPNNNLSMTPELREKLIEYYDFMVAWQNILRDGGNIDLTPGISSNAVSIGAWNPILGQISAFRKEVDSKSVYHLINFDGLNSLEWRDDSGKLSSPLEKHCFSITIPTDQVNKVIYASPDWHDGVQRELDFTISNGNCEIEIPYLHYWGMIIIE